MADIPEKVSSRSIWIFGFIVVLIVFVAAALIGYSQPSRDVLLPLLVVAGVLILLLALGLVAVLFASLGLADGKQALGLPDGSVRAVIAISLIVVFAVAAIFLYGNVANGGRTETKADLSAQEAYEFIDTLNKVPGVQYTVYPALPPRPSGGGGPSTGGGGGSSAAGGSSTGGTPSGASTTRYMVIFRVGGSPAGDDLAKQIITLLGTLITAAASFYFGASSVTSATTAVANTMRGSLGPQSQPQQPHPQGPAPSVTGLSQTTFNQGTTTSLTLQGTNLAQVKGVDLRRDKHRPIHANVTGTPTATQATVNLQIATDSTLAGPWDVWVVDGKQAYNTNQQVTIA